MKKILQNILFYTLALIGMSGILLASAEAPNNIGPDTINYIGLGMFVFAVIFGKVADKKGWINLPDADNRA